MYSDVEFNLFVLCTNNKDHLFSFGDFNFIPAYFMLALTSYFELHLNTSALEQPTNRHYPAKTYLQILL